MKEFERKEKAQRKKSTKEDHKGRSQRKSTKFLVKSFAKKIPFLKYHKKLSLQRTAELIEGSLSLRDLLAVRAGRPICAAVISAESEKAACFSRRSGDARCSELRQHFCWRRRQTLHGEAALESRENWRGWSWFAFRQLQERLDVQAGLFSQRLDAELLSRLQHLLAQLGHLR